MFKDFKDLVIKTVTHRLFILLMLFTVLFMVLFSKIFHLQIIEGQSHLDKFEYRNLKELEINNARGNIYDRKGKLLAYNKLAFNVTYDSTSAPNAYAAMAKKINTNEKETVKINRVMNQSILELVQLLERNGDTISVDFPISMISSNNYQFNTSSQTQQNHFRREVFQIDHKLEKEKYSEIQKQQMQASAKDIIDYLRTGKGSAKEDFKKYDISPDYSDADAFEIVRIRYSIDKNRFTQFNAITIAMDISNESVAQISENRDQFPGFDVAQDSLRVYNYSKYFAHIIGYTGIVSNEDLETLNADKAEKDPSRYKTNSVVGKLGLEKIMESELRGKKGSRSIFVDNLGKPLEEVSATAPIAGNDLYLTIDSEYQKYAYDTLERRLAGILLGRLNQSSADKNPLYITDIYFALLNNNMVDITKFNRGNATPNEKNIYNKMLSKQENTLADIKSTLKTSETPINKLDDEHKEYMSLVYDILNNNNVLLTSNIDSSDSVVKARKAGTISLSAFLRYAIEKSWIDLSVLSISSDFYDLDTVLSELIDYILLELKQNPDFEKLQYKYLIEKSIITGSEVCQLLYDQNVFNKNKDEDYQKLSTGNYSARSFIQAKIKKLEITPADLALDPCSGTVVMTDPDSGKVLAMVSYPSYDNNKLANSVDNEYFAKLQIDNASPQLFRATQSASAPGSTFKPISAIAGLESGTIDTSTIFKCLGVFTEFADNNPKCWKLSGHGNLNVMQAIGHSCNVFFYNTAFNFGTNQEGLNMLAKYASLFGLNETSGLILANEKEPHISTQDAVRSAIGQGNNNFTPSQLAKYVNTIANKGKNYDLGILDNIKNPDGKTIRTFQPELKQELSFKDSTWDAVFNGMRMVINGPDSTVKQFFNNDKLQVAGKTGTAQEDKKRPNHGLFISFAPFTNPEITITTVIPNGVSSANAALVSSDIYKYYFKLEDTTKDGENKVEIITNNNLPAD